MFLSSIVTRSSSPARACGTSASTGTIGLNNFLLDLAGRASPPTTDNRVNDRWTYAYPPSILDRDPPNIITTGFEVVEAQATIGELLSNITIDLPLLNLGLDAVSDNLTFVRQLMLVSMAFDPRYEVTAHFNIMAESSNNPWAILLRSAALDEPVRQYAVDWARSIHTQISPDGPNSNAFGEWVKDNRWVRAMDDLSPNDKQEDYNGLDFLSPTAVVC
ncbi:MAG: hypothetical protein U0840_11685 [Gemmataceae bacterium]